MLTLTDARNIIAEAASLPDAQVQAALDAALADVRRVGGIDYAAGTWTTTVQGGTLYVVLPRPAASVVSVGNHTDCYLDSSGLRVWREDDAAFDSGRLTFTGTMADNTARRRQVAIDLVRIALTTAGSITASTEGPLSQTRGNAERMRRDVLRRLVRG